MPSRRMHENPEYRPRRRRRRRRVRIYWPRFVLTLVCLTLVCFGIVRLTKYLMGARRTAQVNAELAELYEEQPRAEIAAPQQQDPPESTLEVAAPIEEQIPEEIAPARSFHAASGDALEGFDALYAKNPDLIAWLKLPGVFSLPVVYRDNEYYLSHDFYGQQSDSGTLFLDRRHPLDEHAQYLIIHGHAMNDGSMFGYLIHYRQTDYIKMHPRLYFSTKYAQEVYEIVGVLDVSEEEMFTIAHLGSARFENDVDFDDFVSGLRANAMHFTDAEITADDALIALSTCWKDGRIVVIFKRVE